MNDLEIILDKTSFKAGEGVKGHINLNLNEEVKAKGIVVEIYGGEHTKVTRTHSMGKKTVTRTYTEDLDIINKKEIVTNQIITSPTTDDLILPIGQYNASFSFELPEDATPSYSEGSHASVEYVVSAKVDCPWKRDINDKTAIIVLPKDAASTDKSSFINLEEKSGSKWLPQFMSPKIEMAIELNKPDYFVRGDYIKGKIRVTNSSSKEIKNIMLELYANEYAKARGYTENSTVMKHRFKIPVNQPRINHFEQEFDFPIPQDIIPTLKRKYFSIDWYFEIGLDVEKAKDIVRRIPVVIQ